MPSSGASCLRWLGDTMPGRRDAWETRCLGDASKMLALQCLVGDLGVASIAILRDDHPWLFESGIFIMSTTFSYGCDNLDSPSHYFSG
jgi:hypothetical protein